MRARPDAVLGGAEAPGVIGTTVDKYEVLRKVGEGGMSTVYLGRHVALDRDVAIKVLHPHLSASTRNRKRFAREARAIEQLRHPNIVEIFDYSGEGPGDSWIVTEFVDGDTLGAVLERVRTLPSETAAIVGCALAEALAYAHGQGILHRDLKPENVMLRRDGRVKLMDFGIARFLDEAHVTMTGALVGSPAFMSPEQAREDDLDARSDLFSLGTLLFLVVSGRLPFVGGNPSVVLRHILDNVRPALDEVAPDASPAMCELVERLLAPSAADRPASATEVARALRQVHEETGFDPSEERWSVVRFLQEPEAYREELRVWLVPRLLDAARARLAKGEALAGLRLVNRVLSLHEGHPEALALLETLHGTPEQDPEGRRRVAGVAGIVALAITGAVATAGWWGGRPPEAQEPDLDPVATVAVVAPRPPAQELPTDAPTPPAPPAELPELDAPPPNAAPPADPPADRAPEPTAAPEAGDASARAPSPAPARAVRVEEPPPEPVEPATDAAPACVAFRTPEAPAEVYLDGVRLRSTREPGCARVPPGTHTFVLSGPMVQETRVPITLAPGEVRDPVIVRLDRRPARVRFPDALAASCVALVDGVPRGTLGDLGRSLELPHPDVAHEVRVQCGGTTHSQRFVRIDYPEVLFDGGEAP